MTTKQIIRLLKSGGKSTSVPQLYRYFSKLDIRPAGARQRPQIYPADTAERILVHFGFLTPAAAVVPQLPTMRELRRARATSKGRN